MTLVGAVLALALAAPADHAVATDRDEPLARRPRPAIAPPPAAPSRRAPRLPLARVGGDDPDAADADRWFGVDKVKHFLMVGFVESVSYGLARAAGASGNGALVVGVGVGAAASVGKEVYDRRGGRAFSVRDLVWDAAGLLAHGALLAQVDG